ncbi:MAG TPA: multidrug effflux MFS transporter [Noviherbaspirillum sp.]|uniref:multidrug effflux MFS transporter n=1 Tax=Noviherbaspirillum sp. TaxID=1926288 RepID=UPI002B46807F|nr:multidrug effflux MFS transporter [Noviherbaspirillum sp.]HJV84182.1 multidrug effflux MFS transporter [Noviherbaspirillum sp.]
MDAQHGSRAATPAKKTADVPEPRPALPAPPLWMISLVPALGLFASSVHMPSIPAMAVDFGVGPQPVQFTVSVYLAAMAIFALLIGPLSDRFGRRRVGLVLLFVFTLGSFGALFSPNIDLMLVSRLVQGIGASGGVVLSRSMVRDAFDGAAAAKASAQVAMAVSIAPMFGPVFGGYVHELLGWRANFLIVALLSFALSALAVLRFGETLPAEKRYIGGAWSMMTNYFALMRMRKFMAYALPVICGSVGLFTFQTEGPVLLIRLMRVEPADYGLFAAMPAVGFLMGTFTSARLALYVHESRLIESGCLLFIASGLLVTVLALGFVPSPWFVGIPMLLFGAGNGLVTPSATMGSLSAAPLLVGSGAALISCLRMGAGSAGSVLITTMPSGSAASMGIILLGAGIASMVSWRVLRRAKG